MKNNLLDTDEKVSRGLAHYFGIATIIWGLVAFAGVIYWIYLTQQSEYQFDWGIFAGLLAVGVALCAVGVIILTRRSRR
ncbi:MAG: hypothetical protein HC859_16950 [Bacteroidia bacterium]|nr:hypothetical protein [Bacteroidia bacterium]